MSTFQSYLLLAVAALFPVIATLGFFLLEKHTKFSKLNYWLKQVIFGLVFGGLAIVGTEWGIPLNDAQVNCRDAAVLTAGLLFGSPAGLIAGIIGGTERWLAATFWGVAPATKIACSVSTIIAGLYSAGLRKFIFKNEKPNLIMAFFIGLVMEAFHLLMVFITNVDNPSFAYKVVSACTLPMLLFNALSVMLSALIYNIAEKKSIRIKKVRDQNVSTTIQIALVVTCIIAFLISTGVTYAVQVNMCYNQTSDSLEQVLTDLSADIYNTSNQILGPYAYKAAEEASANPHNYMAIAIDNYACDINIVDKNGICQFSLDPEFLNVDFSKRDDTKQFMRLIDTSTNVYEYQSYQKIQGRDVSRKYIGITSKNKNFGFIRLGFDSDDILLLLKDSLKLYAINRHAGNMENSHCIITDEYFNVVSIADSLSPVTIEKDLKYLSSVENNKTIQTSFNSLDSYCRKTTSESFYIISTMGVVASRESLYTDMYLNSFLQIMAYALLFTLVYTLIDRIILRGFNKASSSLKQISEGDLNVNLDVHSSHEFVELSDNINKTVGTLKGYIDEANQRIDKELQLAKDIQSSSLPQVIEGYNNHPCFDIHACMFTAKQVGGDFYDFYFNSKHRLTFAIADVSGKGIPASLFMMRSKQELKSLTEAGLPIDEVFTKGNKSLCEGNDAGMFVTVWQGCLDIRTGDVAFANAGHNAPLIYRKSTGKFEYITCLKGFVMAGLDSIQYKKQLLHLEPGDIIFLYTDGVTEATDNSKKLYGDDRLLNILNSQEFDSMEQLCSIVKKDVDQFVGDAPQFDDITMVALRFKKKDEPKA